MAQATYKARQQTAVPTIKPGPLGRLGVWVTDHRRFVTIVWVLLIVGLGALAPSVEKNLSGAGWQADGSESVAVRDLAQQHFGGNASHAIQVVVHSTDGPLTQGDGPAVIASVTKILRSEPRLAEVVPPTQERASLRTAGPRWFSRERASTRTRWFESPPT